MRRTVKSSRERTGFHKLFTDSTENPSEPRRVRMVQKFNESKGSPAFCEKNTSENDPKDRKGCSGYSDKAFWKSHRVEIDECNCFVK